MLGGEVFDINHKDPLPLTKQNIDYATCRREIMFTNENTHYTPALHPVTLEFVSQLTSKKPKIRLESYSFPIQ